jgi:SAM-dependent methyltransferase
MRRGDYGYDAPIGLILFGGMTLVSIVFAVLTWSRPPGPIFVGYAVFFLAHVASFWFTTRHGKFVEWERILDGLRLRGEERVLDMGCGRGAVLTAVARRLSTGHATGIDIWNTADQSGNAKAVTLRNAELEGVAERVDVETGDMRALPFPDATFDLVVSSLAIHNIHPNDERRKAVREGLRVLKPGGRIVIADIRAISTYAKVLQTAGANLLERRRLGWRFWWGNCVAATRLLIAQKPAE